MAPEDTRTWGTQIESRDEGMVMRIEKIKHFIDKDAGSIIKFKKRYTPRNDVIFLRTKGREKI
jgi:hypothetical protein